MTGDHYIAYELTPPPEMARENFVQFVQEEVFPLVFWGPTRVGAVTGLYLLTTQAADKYLWVLKWNGVEASVEFMDVRTQEAREKLAYTGALVSAASPFYHEVASKE